MADTTISTDTVAPIRSTAVKIGAENNATFAACAPGKAKRRLSARAQVTMSPRRWKSFKKTF